MANQKYDHVAEMIASGDFNWRSDHVFAYLVKTATFDPAHTKYTDVTDAVRVATTDVQGRAVTDEGEALGLPVTFPQVDKDIDYQVLLVQDTPDQPLVAFYDQDAFQNTLRLTNNGTLIVRPVLYTEGDTPTIGVWFTVGA